MQKQQHLLSSRHCLLGKIWLTRWIKQSYSPCLAVLYSVTPFCGYCLIWLSPPFLFWVILCVGVSPPCNEGHQPWLLFIPTVTVHPSDEDTMFNNGCLLGTNWKWICTDINTLFTTIIKPGCTQGRLNRVMLRCVMFNGRCIWIVYLLFIPQIKTMPHFLENWMIKRLLPIITTCQTVAAFWFYFKLKWR